MTISTVELVELEPTPVVVLPTCVRLDALGDEISRAITRVEAAVTAAQVPVAGAPFVRYLTRGPELQIEVGIPLTGSHAVPTLRASLLPGGPAAVTWYSGPQSGLTGAFAGLEAWAGADADPQRPPWESYWTPPDADPIRVQLVWPVVGP